MATWATSGSATQTAAARPSPTSSPTWHCRPRATATTSSNVALIGRLFELFIGGRVEEAKPLLDPDIDWIEPEEAPDRRVVKGADAALAALRDWLDTWSAYEVEVLEVVETSADRVFVTMRQRATGAVSGVPSEGELFQVWTFSDGRPVRMEFFFDRQKAVAAAGLA